MLITTKKPKPVIFSFFSGSGFLDLGFEAAGFRVGYVNEYHQAFLNAYKHSRKILNINPPEYGYFNGDIEELIRGDGSQSLRSAVENAKMDYALVGFIGGPPCPDFSVAGKNKGKEGDNGKLSKTYIDLICIQKPDFFVFENVKGLYRTKKHKEFFNGLKKQLEDEGYILSERLINAIEYGAPQDRERIILVGFLRSHGKIDMGAFDWNAHTTHPNAKKLNAFWPGVEELTLERSKPDLTPAELTVQYWFSKNNVESHPNSKHFFTPRAGLQKFQTVLEGDVSKKSYKRLHRWRYSPTAAYGNNEVHIHPYLPRRISVAEALAIQSLPREFELPQDMTLTDMFKTVGNGVPFLAAKGVAMTIMDFLALLNQDINSEAKEAA